MPADCSFQAAQAFLVEAKQYWMADVYGALRREVNELSAGRSLQSADEVATLLDGNTTHAYYAWLERHIQKQKYAGRYGLMRHVEAPPPAAAPNPLQLDPGLEIPDYYRAIDTHQHPGNLHGTAHAGRVYKASASSTQPGATAGYALHERFAGVLAELGEFQHILDMGCGFGKSALPIAQRWPAAHVIGIDLAAPCLEVAAAEARAAELGNLRYEQADLRRTGHADGTFDLVTSTMVLHELDPPALREMLQESHRVLAPGGTAVHLDFQVHDPFLEFVYDGHGVRNNEPYMRTINQLDLVAELRAAGFVDVRIAAFEETPGATRADWPRWRFPWATFVATKPGPERAGDGR